MGLILSLYLSPLSHSLSLTLSISPTQAMVRCNLIDLLRFKQPPPPEPENYLVSHCVECRLYPCISLFGPADPSFRALSGRLKFTVGRQKLNQDSLKWSDIMVHEKRDR